MSHSSPPRTATDVAHADIPTQRRIQHGAEQLKIYHCAQPLQRITRRR